MTHYLAIDFGGTRIRSALFDSDMRMVERAETLTQVHEGQDKVIRRIIEIGKSVVPDNCLLQGIGVAAPGPLDAERGIILHAKILPEWSRVPLASILSAAFGYIPAFVENDANLGAVAEYHMGAGKGSDPMLYLTISTGIGGGAMIDGKLFTGADALAIEPGHMRFTLPDGSHRRLEELASGTAIGDWANRYLAQEKIHSILNDVIVVDGQAVGQAARMGDVLALRVVTEAGRWLGLGLVNLIHLFNPQAIVLGGSVVQLGDLLLNPAREIVQESILDSAFYNDKLLRVAAINDDVCLVGAAYHCLNRL
ncbi:MAG: ROK family protein [Chloroflexota bacterium]